MSFEAALVEELATGALAGKVFPLTAPEGTIAPYLVYLSSEGASVRALEGFLDEREIQGELNVIHETYSGLKSLAAAVLTTFRSFEGRQIGTGGPFIQSLDYEEPVELFENQVKLYRCHIRFSIHI